jgi:hypothetical protein
LSTIVALNNPAFPVRCFTRAKRRTIYEQQNKPAKPRPSTFGFGFALSTLNSPTLNHRRSRSQSLTVAHGNRKIISSITPILQYFTPL